MYPHLSKNLFVAWVCRKCFHNDFLKLTVRSIGANAVAVRPLRLTVAVGECNVFTRSGSAAYTICNCVACGDKPGDATGGFD